MFLTKSKLFRLQHDFQIHSMIVYFIQNYSQTKKQAVNEDEEEDEDIDVDVPATFHFRKRFSVFQLILSHLKLLLNLNTYIVVFFFIIKE